MKILILFLLIFTSCSKAPLLEIPFTKNSLKACFIGDVGTGSLIQRKVAALLNQENCEAIWIVGDLIYPSGIETPHDAILQEKFLTPYADLLQKKIPIYLLLGNHDYRQNPHAWVEVASLHPPLIHPSPYYQVRQDGLCFVGVDSNPFRILWRLPQALWQWLWIGGLDLKGCELKLVLAHHHYQSRGYHGNASGLWKLFLDSSVLGKYDYLITGHDHILSDEGEVKGTRHLITGAGGAPQKNESPGFLVLEFKKTEGKWQAEEITWRKIGPGTP